jgi:hypothetical protein
METENNETYPLKIITNWCREKNIDFRYSSYKSRILFFYEHGIRIKLNTYDISIQTHPEVTAWSFAETLKSNDMSSDKRHASPEQLFEYLEKCVEDSKKDEEIINQHYQ